MKKAAEKRLLTLVILVPGRELESPHLAIHGPEPCASTNSATWAGVVTGDLQRGPDTVNGPAKNFSQIFRASVRSPDGICEVVLFHRLCGVCADPKPLSCCMAEGIQRHVAALQGDEADV